PVFFVESGYIILDRGNKPLKRISVLIPAYNAETTIGSVLKKLEALGIETFVVNDGSTDKTAEVVRRFGVTLIEHPSNLGKGAALRTGFQSILKQDYDLVITLDADGQHDPLQIPILLKAFQAVEPDLLIASRAWEFHRMTFLRRFWNRLGVKAVSRLCHADITDSQSGFRLIRTRVLREISLTTKGFEMELELLIKACKKGFSVLSIPITVTNVDGRHTSHFRPVTDTWLVCKLFLKSLLW
ncbi:MAG: glycosyltransferase family 2 protein, partial [Desulfobacterota bacterium]|nr:glycosyltransferase family 2 protein [Thermodesulfobacteriota bacterium]